MPENSHFLRLAKTGHMGMFEKPIETTQFIEGFLNFSRLDQQAKLNLANLRLDRKFDKKKKDKKKSIVFSLNFTQYNIEEVLFFYICHS